MLMRNNKGYLSIVAVPPRLVLLLISLLLITVNAFAQTKQKQDNQEQNAPIDIESQYLLIDENKGISYYKGKVLFTRASLIIKADAITLYQKNGAFTKALIIGSPADVQHQPQNEEKVHSQASQIEYYFTTEQIFLSGNAFVDQGESHFSGEKIEYDASNKTLVASAKNNKASSNEKKSKNNSSSGRVHVIIEPNNDDSDDDDNNE